MGIELERQKRGRVRVARRNPRSSNVYLNLTHHLYKFLARRTNSNFNKVVSKRLAASRMHRPPLSLGRVIRATKKRPNDTVVCVGTVTDDVRFLNVPPIKLCALRVTEGARRKILKNGGEVLTFDQLALRSPLGKNTYLLRGPTKARNALRFFNGAPRVRSEGRKFERGKHHKTVDRKRLRKKW